MAKVRAHANWPTVLISFGGMLWGTGFLLGIDFVAKVGALGFVAGMAWVLLKRIKVI